MENRLHEFTIIEWNAWHEIYLYTILEEKTDGKLILNVAYGNKTSKIDVTDEDSFIQRIEDLNLITIDNKDYYHSIGYEDGYGWYAYIAYDEIEIVSRGDNAAPDEYLSLLISIGCKEKLNSSAERKRVRFHRMNKESRVRNSHYPRYFKNTVEGMLEEDESYKYSLRLRDKGFGEVSVDSSTWKGY